MRRYLSIIIGILLFISMTYNYLLSNKVSSISKQLNNTMINYKAYVIENSKLKDLASVFKLTIDQLNYINDSIMDRMNDVRNLLKIKDSNLKLMLYLLSVAQKTDTIRFVDTIFMATTQIDTTIMDDWYKLKLGLEYPNIVTVTPWFKSEKYIITSYKKETINPPKKFWLFRLFQRKHKILNVDIIESNPYISNNKLRFVEIIN